MNGDRETASERVGEAVDDLVGWFSGLSVADWLGIAFALAALYWIWASLRAMTRLGPVVVDPLEGEAEGKLPMKELTAMLRERLAHGGLVPPPEVPAGAPQANLLSAIEASNVPQAALIAQLLGTLPRPRPTEYKLGGTLIGEPPAPPSEDDDGGPRANPPAGSPVQPPAGANDVAQEQKRGLSFWLRPSREGRELLETIKKDEYPDAVRCAADKASLHIIEHSARILPLWVRWSDLKAFASYIDGIEQSVQDHDLAALRKFVSAAGGEPTNLLVRLKIANLQERRAGNLRQDRPRAIAQARALEQYLRVARLQPGLVEARYRASVLAGMLASSVETQPGAAAQEVCNNLPILGVAREVVVKTLRELAVVESRAVLQLLRPWYALLQESRLRHQLEVKGFDRRQLRRTVAISKHCLRARRLALDRRWRVSIELWLRKLVVRYWYIAFGGGWQAHYNAACFFGLLYSRARKLQEGPP